MSSKGWSWVPSLYFAEGLPYAFVSSVSLVMFKNLGMDNVSIAFLSSIITLPWVLKPLWAPVLDLVSTKKRWVTAMQLAMGVGFAVAAAALFGPAAILVAMLFMIAFASATHDAAADGFYMIGLDGHGQAFFSGVRGTAYRIATVTVQGALVMLAGFLIGRGTSTTVSWAAAMAVMAAVLLLLGFYHSAVLPRVEKPAEPAGNEGVFSGMLEVFASFFRKPHIGKALSFLLLYRLGESQLVKLAAPFMLDAPEAGGMGLSTLEHGFFYGTIGISAMLCGGLLGGFAIARGGFRRWLWPMALAINLPDLLYVMLASMDAPPRLLIAVAVALEQAGYGFGFTLYMLFMVAYADGSGRYRTSHFALMTAFMALGMLLPGMAAGAVQSLLGGYREFFWYVVLCTLPGFAAAAMAAKAIPPDFGKRREAEE